MGATQQVVLMRNQLQLRHNHVCSLKPGYRFCPTDSELIVYYLKEKIETGKHPICRLYEINIYDHNPKELTDGLRPCDDKWYFLAPRDQRKNRNGKQPSRKTKCGFWRATQEFSTVYHDDKIRGRMAVGKKRSLAYFDVNEEKTLWLMHEYTTNDPDLAIGTKGNKMCNWVLCKIYKKEQIRVDNNTNHAQQVQNTRNAEQNNRNDDETSPIRRSVNQESSNQQNDQDVHIQHTSDDKSVLTDLMCSISALIIVVLLILYWPRLLM